MIDDDLVCQVLERLIDIVQPMADSAARREASIAAGERDRVRPRGARTDGGARPRPAARRLLLRVQVGGLLDRRVRPC